MMGQAPPAGLENVGRCGKGVGKRWEWLWARDGRKQDKDWEKVGKRLEEGGNGFWSRIQATPWAWDVETPHAADKAFPRYWGKNAERWEKVGTKEGKGWKKIGKRLERVGKGGKRSGKGGNGRRCDF